MISKKILELRCLALIKAKKVVVKTSRLCLYKIIRNSEKLNMKIIFVVLAALYLGYSVYNT